MTSIDNRRDETPAWATRDPGTAGRTEGEVAEDGYQLYVSFWVNHPSSASATPSPTVQTPTPDPVSLPTTPSFLQCMGTLSCRGILNTSSENGVTLSTSPTDSDITFIPPTSSDIIPTATPTRPRHQTGFSSPVSDIINKQFSSLRGSTLNHVLAVLLRCRFPQGSQGVGYRQAGLLKVEEDSKMRCSLLRHSLSHQATSTLHHIGLYDQLGHADGPHSTLNTYPNIVGCFSWDFKVLGVVDVAGSVIVGGDLVGGSRSGSRVQEAT
ncbi:hypothetical protein BJ165DRAFT_1410784 [Panaeolus papilionaceus]|nr:hypothetical protein BJ165DRAFT_1410784 [Panaeolus papilionaceus]